MRGTVIAAARAWCIVVVLSALGPAALAQTAAPPAQQLGPPLAIDLAPGWKVGERALAEQTFNTRVNTYVSNAIHATGSRMSDMPYGLVDAEDWPTPGLPNAVQQRAIADAVAEYFRTPLTPPSKAERSPAWKKAKLSPIRYDPANNRFSFDATITYDFDGDRHVNVCGLVNADGMFVLGIWSDAAYYQQNAPALAAMRDSFRFTSGNVNPIESAKQSFLSKTRWLVGFVLIAVVVVQVVVLVRERRQRRAELEAMIGPQS